MRQTKGNHNRAAPGAMMKFRHPMLDENFDREQLDQRLEWRNPPERWWMDDATSRLMVEPRGRTDYWRKTAYGFEADNGPALVVEIGGDFVLTTRVRSYPAHQYDQAGLLIHCSPECWLKTSVEYEPGGPCQLGVVATNGGYSDWSLQDFPRDRREISLRVRLRGGDCLVEFQAEDGAWKHLRVAHLSGWQARRSAYCGLYACCPKEAGFRAEFDYLRIQRFPPGQAFFANL